MNRQMPLEAVPILLAGGIVGPESAGARRVLAAARARTVT
jgi:hypothetical protein